MKNYKFILILFLFLVVFSFSFSVFSNTANAAIVQCGRTGADATAAEKRDCNTCDIIALVKTIIDFMLVDLVPAVAVLFYLFAGFMMILAGANKSMLAIGKKYFWNTTIGIAIMFSSWMIANSILKSFAGVNDASNSWFTIDCQEPAAPVIPPATGQKYSCNSNNQCVADANGIYPTADCYNKCQPIPIGGGTCAGKSCGSDTLACGPVANNKCSQNNMANINQAWGSDVNAVAAKVSICSGIDTAKMLKAIMSQESGGFIGAVSPDGLSLGLMQLQVGTANLNKAGCTTDNITKDWLLDPHHAQESLCVAANYLKSLAVTDCGCDVRQIAAGYNGSRIAGGACGVSQNCGPNAASVGGQCSACANQSGSTRRWECLWDTNDHQDHLPDQTACNKDRSGGSFAETRAYAPKVEYCYSQF